MTVSLSDVERETVFMDDLMLVINDVFNSGVVLDRGTILAKATAVSLGLEFVFAGKVTVKGKCLMRWSVLRPKLHGLCIDLLAELQKHFETNTGEAAQDPASIGSTLLQVLEQDDKLDGDDAGKSWMFQLDAGPTLNDTVIKVLGKNNFSVPVQNQTSYHSFVAYLHASKGNQKPSSAYNVLQCLADACSSCIPASVVDFAAAAVEASLAQGGTVPDGLDKFFQSSQQAQLVAMSRTAFSVHATAGFVETLPQDVLLSPSIVALKTFMGVLATEPVLLAQFACCEALATSSDEDSDNFRKAVADLLQPGCVYTNVGVRSIIEQLQPGHPIEEDRATATSVKLEVATPAARPATPEPSHQKQMTFSEILSVGMDNMPMLGDSPFFKNISELHTLALQIEELLFTKFRYHAGVHSRLSVDVLSNKSQVTLNNVEVGDKLVFCWECVIRRQAQSRVI